MSIDGFDDVSAALAARYRIERELGQGGMAIVYLAHDVRHDRRVALKVLRPELAADIAQERFLREIGIAATLTHRNIVTLLDSGAAGDTLFYTMPYLDGGSLRARLDRERELPIGETVRIVSDIVEALRYAHSAGIVHRDIKPENILFTGGRAQVADFGIAKAVAQSSSPRLTGTGFALGTPAYMAPEQGAADPRLDHRADIYALGVLWYEMLTGAPLFGDLAPQQQIAAHMIRAPQPPNQLRPSIPQGMSDAVLRCLEKRPADRWQTADELALVITAFGNDSFTMSGARGDHAPTLEAFTITDALTRRLSPDAFDPRMVGDQIQYLDNGRVSDTLVCYFPRWCIDPDDGRAFVSQTPYRAIVPAFFGFDAGRRYRVSLSVSDHFTLVGGLLASLVATTGARHVVLVGFSSGGDLALRFAAAEPASHGVRIDGALALGANLSIDTAFLSAELARMDGVREDAVLAFLRRVTERMESLQDWLDVNEYLVRLMRRFRSDMPVLQAFAKDLVSSLTVVKLTAFVESYRAATRAGCEVRCVFEDSPLYRGLVREVQTSHREAQLLGAHFQDGSLVVEAGTGHFDLETTPLITRHLDALVQALHR